MSLSVHKSAATGLAQAFAVVCLASSAAADEANVLAVPEASFAVHMVVDLPADVLGDKTRARLVEMDGDSTEVPVQLVPRVAADGTVAGDSQCFVTTIPPQERANGARKFKLQPTSDVESAASRFKLTTIDDKSLKLVEGDKPVLVYNYGTIIGANVPENDRRRRHACYIHPLWGLDGEILTDDFPRDHFHHHGVFWAWPHVAVGGAEYDLWTTRGIEQRFVRWLHQQVGPVAAVIGVENGWFVGDRQVMTERVWVRVFGAIDRERSVDVDLYYVPKEEITLQGAGGKSYGGLTARFAVRNQNDVMITVPDGQSAEDLKETPLPWADLTTQFENAPGRSGGAVFVHPNHPDYPPTWLTRHYGPLCVGWPGVKARTFEPGKPFRLAYRLMLHRGVCEVDALKLRYQAYAASTKAAWRSPPSAAKAE